MKTAVGAALTIALALGWFAWRRASRRFRLPCPAWLSWLVELDNPLARENRAKRIIEHLSVVPGMTILDAGCGPGRLTIPLSVATGTSGEVVAMDAQEAMTEIVRRKARDRGLQNITLLSSSLGSGALEANHFDSAVLVTVLGEIPDRESAMAELYRALKPAGLLSVTETVFDPHYQNRATVLRLADGVGFSLRATFGNRLAYTVHFEKSSAQPSAPGYTEKPHAPSS